jgi:uncharacterized damage-inducible protein DinB
MAIRWVDRTFDFSFPVGVYPVVFERLRGTPARLEEKLRALDHPTRTRRRDSAWSIQEHAGHLLDLDELHFGRLDDYDAGASVLRAADLSNRKTEEADHNARPVEDLLRAFRGERARFLARLEAWNEERLARVSRHPRLERPMRAIDMAWFVAEHDDHHLATMTTLARELQSGSG